METTSLSLLESKKRIDALIKKSISELGPKSSLRDACEYALLSEGKRFRPALVFLMAEAIGKGRDVTYPALATEYFHTASLIADDLPCMDDEEKRRGRITTHLKFGESTALLATYALIAAGYGWISNGESQEVCSLALQSAAKKTGILGATGGQFLDLDPPLLTEESISEIIHKKTSTLFELSFVFGWLFGGGEIERLDTVKKAACHFGLAFQIADDLDDQEQDLLNGRAVNFANVVGTEKARTRLAYEKQQYLSAIQSLNIETTLLESLLALV